MAILPDDGTCSYNGVTFNSHIRSSMKGEPVYDGAGRTVKYMKYLLEIEAIIQNDNTTDVTFDSYRKLLTQPAGELEYNNRGFGTFHINGNSGVRDVCFGPKPRLLYFQSIGASQCARLGWQCEICIPECVQGVGGDYLSFNFEIVWGIDSDGYTTVTYSGEAEIPMTRRFPGDVNIPDTADAYREKIAFAFPVLPAMQRDSQDWRLSPDRRILSFTIRDKEAPMPLPLDATRIQASEELMAVTDGGACSFAVWDLAIRGEITLKRGADKKQIALLTEFILASRVEPWVFKGFLVLARGLSLTDDVFGRGGGFSANFQIIADLAGLGEAAEVAKNNHFIQTLHIMALAGELWTPLPGMSFPVWQRSLEDSSGHSRGFLKARHRRQDDAIIDLCNTDTAKGTRGSVANPRRTNIAPARPRFGGPPRPSNSWLEYFIEIVYEEDGSVVQHTPVGNVRELGPASRGGIDSTSPGIEKSRYAPEHKKVSQTLDPNRTVVVRGRAKRAGYEAPPPKLAHIGGTPVKEVGRRVSVVPVERVGGIVIWETAWKLRYVPDEPPRGKVDSPPDAIKLRQGGSRYSPG